MKLLVVEDDQALQSQLVHSLRGQHYEVDACDDGVDALFQAREFEYDMAVIDIGLPKISGIDVIKSLRSEGSRLPILILTARSSWQDKVLGLKAGADDYLVKPFEFAELLARIEAMLRRAQGYHNVVIESGPIQLNTQTQEVRVNGHDVDLTAFEYKLLTYFLRNPKRIVSKSALMDYLYDEDNERDVNVLEVLIGRLRRKLDPQNQVKPIETLRGRGYRYALKVV